MLESDKVFAGSIPENYDHRTRLSASQASPVNRALAQNASAAPSFVR